MQRWVYSSAARVEQVLARRIGRDASARSLGPTPGRANRRTRRRKTDLVNRPVPRWLAGVGPRAALDHLNQLRLTSSRAPITKAFRMEGAVPGLTMYWMSGCTMNDRVTTKAWVSSSATSSLWTGRPAAR